MKRSVSISLMLVPFFAFQMVFSSCNNINKNESKVQQNESDKELLNKELDTIKKDKEEGENQKNTLINSKKSSLEHLKAFQNKYAFEVHLLEDKELKKRMKVMMPEERYEFLYDRWAVETPIEMRDDVFVSEACERHNCPNTNFIIVVDYKKDVLYVGIREEFNVEYFTEDGSKNEILTKWGLGN